MSAGFLGPFPGGKMTAKPMLGGGFEMPQRDRGAKGEQPDKRPTTDPTIDDPMYWNNVAALNAEYTSLSTQALAEQNRADLAYEGEAARMSTDRENSRLSLAESLMGRGGIYSGMHRRQQTLEDAAYIANAGRLSQDKTQADAARLVERTEIADRLAPDTGTDWIREKQASADRKVAAQLERGETGKPDSSQSAKDKTKAVKGQIKAKNARIKRLRARAAKTEDPKKRKQIRKKIHKVRKSRDKLKGKLEE